MSRAFSVFPHDRLPRGYRVRVEVFCRTKDVGAPAQLLRWRTDPASIEQSGLNLFGDTRMDNYWGGIWSRYLSYSAGELDGRFQLWGQLGASGQISLSATLKQGQALHLPLEASLDLESYSGARTYAVACCIGGLAPAPAGEGWQCQPAGRVVLALVQQVSADSGLSEAQKFSRIERLLSFR